MQAWQLSASMWLALTVVLSGSLVTVLALPTWAQTAIKTGESRIAKDLSDVVADQPTAQGSDLSFVVNPSVSSSPAQLNGLEPPATTVTDWIAQIEASIVQVTDVRVETTEAGLQVVLETAEGQLIVLTFPDKSSNADET